MDSRLLMVLPQAEASSLQGFHATRMACRMAVRKRPALGAALLFSGDCILVLLEGPPEDLLACADSIVVMAGPLPFESCSEPIAAGAPRHLSAGTCRVGYLDIDQRGEPVPSTGPEAARMQAFLRLLEASDHD